MCLVTLEDQHEAQLGMQPCLLVSQLRLKPLCRLNLTANCELGCCASLPEARPKHNWSLPLGCLFEITTRGRT